jgi:hypothetical protein
MQWMHANWNKVTLKKFLVNNIDTTCTTNMLQTTI